MLILCVCLFPRYDGRSGSGSGSGTGGGIGGGTGTGMTGGSGIGSGTGAEGLCRHSCCLEVYMFNRAT
jgi:hypothetical protein